MPTVKLTLDQLPAWARSLGKRLKPATVRGLQRGAMQALPVLQDATRFAPPASPAGQPGAVNTGALLRGWRAVPEPNGVLVTNSVPYAPVVEYGRRAGARQPPLRVIEQWARRRLRLNAKEAKAAAYPIARAIAKRGLDARLILTDKLTPLKELVMVAVRAELRRELGKK